MWFDTHCHFTLAENNSDEILAAAAASNVDTMVTVGCTVADSRKCIETAEPQPNIWVAAGVHPHEAKDGIAGLEALLAHEKVKAVGECGLDYYYENSPREVQPDVFAAQIELAKKHDLALVIHSRDAWDDTFAVLDEAGMPERTVFHCFTGGVAEAEKCLERGAYLSFSGIVTFTSASDVQQAAAMVPDDKIVIETDAPFLAPVPLRGKKNQPANVALVGAFVAQLRGASDEVFAQQTHANASKLFDLA